MVFGRIFSSVFQQQLQRELTEFLIRNNTFKELVRRTQQRDLQGINTNAAESLSELEKTLKDKLQRASSFIHLAQSNTRERLADFKKELAKELEEMDKQQNSVDKKR